MWWFIAIIRYSQMEFRGNECPAVRNGFIHSHNSQVNGPSPEEMPTSYHVRLGPDVGLFQSEGHLRGNHLILNQNCESK